MFTGKKSMLLMLILGVAAGSLVSSCRKDAVVKFGEQYKKNIYIVHAENIEYVKEHSFEKENDTITLSVYCASSEPISKNVSVLLKKDIQVLDSLNYLNSLSDANYVAKSLLEDTRYNFEEGRATIGSGRQYGLLKIPVNLIGIDVDKEYVLPIRLVGNDAGFDMNSKLSTIGYRPKMINRFSGDFVGSSKIASEKATRSISPLLQAIAKNTVRMPIHNFTDDKEFLATNYMLLTIAENGRSVSILPYKNSSAVDEGGSFYDAELKQFTLNYSFVEGAEKKFVQAVIKNIDAIDQ